MQRLLPVITVNEAFISVFSEEAYSQTARGGMLLTEQIAAVNLRLRQSAVGYSSDWHIAGDPTSIIIQQGTLRIILRDGNYRDFFAGDAFIAKDVIPEHIAFDAEIHGHRAEVIGTSILQAIHIKLASLSNS